MVFKNRPVDLEALEAQKKVYQKEISDLKILCLEEHSHSNYAIDFKPYDKIINSLQKKIDKIDRKMENEIIRLGLLTKEKREMEEEMKW